MSKDKTPKGWKTHSMGDVLGPTHGDAFTKIWNKHDGNFDAVQKEFRAYLQPFKAEFSARGFDVDYLSYAVPYYVQQNMAGEKAAQAADQAHSSMDLANDIMRKMHKPNNPWN